MTNAEKNIKQIEQLLNQYGDGWFFCGFNPKDGESMMCVSVQDGKTEIALNAMISALLQSGGVGAFKERLRIMDEQQKKPPDEEEE